MSSDLLHEFTVRNRVSNKPKIISPINSIP